MAVLSQHMVVKGIASSVTRPSARPGHCVPLANSVSLSVPRFLIYKMTVSTQNVAVKCAQDAEHKGTQHIVSTQQPLAINISDGRNSKNNANNCNRGNGTIL